MLKNEWEILAETLKGEKEKLFEKLTLCDCTKAVLNGNFILTMVWAWNKQAR